LKKTAPRRTKASDSDVIWAATHRLPVQALLLKLYRLTRTPRAREIPARASVLSFAVGAAFSLWRAVLLLHDGQEQGTIDEAEGEFLQCLVQDNAIGYYQEQKTFAWTGRYYLNSAMLRLAKLDAARLRRAGFPAVPGIEAVREYVETAYDARAKADLRAAWLVAFKFTEKVCAALKRSATAPNKRMQLTKRGTLAGARAPRAARH
jgi:hypothetical protein